MTPVDNKVVPTLTLAVEREWINNAAWILSLKYKAAGIHKSDEAIWEEAHEQIHALMMIEV
jgi:hypothetical protein